MGVLRVSKHRQYYDVYNTDTNPEEYGDVVVSHWQKYVERKQSNSIIRWTQKYSFHWAIYWYSNICNKNKSFVAENQPK